MNKLSKASKLAYGVGQTGWAAKDTCFQFFLFFYYTQILGLSPGLAGLAALLALIADGITDPIVGQISDNFRKNKWGRRHPFMIFAVLPFSLALIAIFNPPINLSSLQLFSWFLTWAIVVRTFLTLFSVPHMALGAELSTDYTERTSIAVYRTVITYIAAIIIQVCAWFYLIPSAMKAGNVALGYQNVGLVAAILALLGMTISIFGTRKQIPNLPCITVQQQSRPWYFAFADVIGLLRYPAAKVLLLSNLVMISAMGVGNTMLIHINTYFYGFSSQQIGIFMLCVLVALVPASSIAMKWTKAYGKRGAIVKMILIITVIGPIPFILHILGLLPENGSPMLLLIVGAFVFVHQSFYIAHLTISGSMLPDVADEIELGSSMRQEGVLNSALMLTQKITFGLGAFIGGLAIEFAGITGTIDAADVSSEMVLRLGLAAGPGVALFSLLGAWLYSRYPLTKERYSQVRLLLDKREA